MRIISKTFIRDYYTKNPQAKAAFNSVDSVGNQRYVFNIKGNDYRMVVVIKFTPQNVLIRFIGTHAEYDKIKDIKNI